MTPEQFRELDRLFRQLADLDAAERAASLDELRGRSPEMADRLEAMLAADAGIEAAGGAGPITDIVAHAAAQAIEDGDPLIGARFGPYRIEQIIGRGGMGAVYLGVRDDDEFQHKVAIKTIRLGGESPEVLARFRRERQILARLNHPGIARLLDGGSGPRGVPYVVMEYVTGAPLIDHVTRESCDLRRRLELFLELCDAVEFVHRNLVIHRDIKPANVMVTDDGMVKLLDFGIARLAEGLDGGDGAETATGHRVMTPEYASPEQVLGRPVTTSTDVYALGLVLYELLTGRRPLEHDSSTPYAMVEAIVNQAPTPPSEMVSAASGERIAAMGPAPRLRRRLRGDLDRIVLMALRKEPERRYPTVAALAGDVRNFLEDRPVAAQADRWHYHARKFVVRHPVASALAALFAVVVLGFTSVVTRQRTLISSERDRAVAAEREARTEAATAIATANFLEDLFGAADPRQAGDRTMSARDILDAGVARLGPGDGLEPDVRGRLYIVLGLALANLREYDAGIASLRRAVETFESVHGRDSLRTAEAMHRLGDVLRRVGRRKEAWDLLSEAMRIRERRLPGDSDEMADSYNNLAILAVDMNRFAKAERLQEASVAMHARVSGEGSPALATPLHNLALLERRLGRRDRALELARRSHAIYETMTDQLSTQNSSLLIARLTRELGDPAGAKAMFEALREGYTRLLGPDADLLWIVEREIAECEELAGDLAAAATRYDRVLAHFDTEDSRRSIDYVLALIHRASLDRRLGHLDAAGARLREALRRHIERTGPDHYRVAEIRTQLADVLVDEGSYEEAGRLIDDALAALPDPDTIAHVDVAQALLVRARLSRLVGRPEAARTALESARAVIDATSGAESPEMAAWRSESEALGQ